MQAVWSTSGKCPRDRVCDRPRRQPTSSELYIPSGSRAFNDVCNAHHAAIVEHRRRIRLTGASDVFVPADPT